MTPDASRIDTYRTAYPAHYDAPDHCGHEHYGPCDRLECLRCGVRGSVFDGVCDSCEKPVAPCPCVTCDRCGQVECPRGCW